MKDFIEQADKNKIILYDKGSCQFCGADYERGIFECMENYNNGLMLDFSNPDFHLTRFMSVDAHALQHPEIHGRWSNHFHLTRLNLIFDKKIAWNYGLSPLLSDYLNKYKVQHPDEVLITPKPMERGNITTKDLLNATSIAESIQLVKSWAYAVYESWEANLVISEIANGFMKNKLR